MEGCIWEVNVSKDVDHFPLGLEPMPYTSVALMGQYLNVSHGKLGTIIIRLSTSYSMTVRTQGHCPLGYNEFDFFLEIDGCKIEI